MALHASPSDKAERLWATLHVPRASLSTRNVDWRLYVTRTIIESKSLILLTDLFFFRSVKKAMAQEPSSRTPLDSLLTPFRSDCLFVTLVIIVFKCLTFITSLKRGLQGFNIPVRLEATERHWDSFLDLVPLLLILLQAILSFVTRTTIAFRSLIPLSRPSECLDQRERQTVSFPVLSPLQSIKTASSLFVTLEIIASKCLI